VADSEAHQLRVAFKKQLARERKEMNILGKEDRFREKKRKAKVEQLKQAKQPIPLN
jgi:hypothetical protein